MSDHVWRPSGIKLVAAAIAVSGVASLVDALRFAQLAPPGSPSGLSPTFNVPSSLVSLIVGLLVLRRSYSLWTFRRPAWLVTVALVGTRAALAAGRVIETQGAIDAWIELSVAVATALYLTQPSVRSLFFQGQSAR
jgi:hypothetical protein